MRMSPKTFGERVGRSTRTLQRWARSGLLVPHRLPSGRPFYDESHLRLALSLHGAPRGDDPWGHRALPDGRFAAVDPAQGADNPAPFGPAGRMHMSVADYAAFLRLYAARGGGFVSAATMAKLLTPPADMGPQPYAFGWGVRAGDAWAAGGPTLYHNGSNTLWYASANVAPSRGLAVFSLANEVSRGRAANTAVMAKLVEIHSA